MTICLSIDLLGIAYQGWKELSSSRPDLYLANNVDMSDTTVDYSDSKIDAGGDNTYDSSQYGTTTGVNDAPKHKDTAQDHESQHTQKDKGQLHEQAQNYGSQEQDDAMTTAESRAAQGYTKSGPNIGA